MGLLGKYGWTYSLWPFCYQCLSWNNKHLTQRNGKNEIIRRTFGGTNWSSSWNSIGKKLNNGKIASCEDFSAGRIDFVTLDNKSTVAQFTLGNGNF